MQVKFDHTENVAKNIVSFWFTTDSMPHHTAGQFTELRIPHNQVDKRGDKRWFTISSSPTEKQLAITTKFAAENGSSFKNALRGLQPGSELNMAQPMGDFVLPKDPSIPLVFVAGGIGVTPMRSMVKYLLDSGEKRDIHLIYGIRSLEEVAFRDLFEQYGLKLTLVVSQPSGNWDGEAGQLSADRIQSLAGGLNNKLIYLSGPEPMTEALFKDLKKLGINKKHIVTDYFPGYTAV